MSKSLVVNTPFKADHVGSFLRPARLKEARLQFENNEITAVRSLSLTTND